MLNYLDHASLLLLLYHTSACGLSVQCTVYLTLLYIQQQQPFYGPLSGTTRVSWYQKKHSPTNHPDHHPIFTTFFHLLRSIASSVRIACLAIFLRNLCPCPFWYGALHLIFHTFLHPVSVFFSQHLPIPSQPVLL